MQPLKEMHCSIKEEEIRLLNNNEVQEYMEQLPGEWKVMNGKKLITHFPFANFKQGMVFAREVEEISEIENHHPDICIHYTGVDLELWTHAVDGLSLNDFILAARISDL